MEENNEVTKKEIALTGKFCVVRALKKISKDAIQEELMKIKGRPLSTDFTRPEWFPYRIGLCYGEDNLVELEPLLSDASPLEFYQEALEQKEDVWKYPRLYILDNEAEARMKADELNALKKEVKYTDFQRDFIYHWICDYTLANYQKIDDKLDRDYITAVAYDCGDRFLFGIKRDANFDCLSSNDVRFIRLTDNDPMNIAVPYDTIVTTPEETDDDMLSIYVSHFGITVPDYFDEDDHTHGLLCKWLYPWHRLTPDDYPIKKGMYFIKTSNGAFGVGFYGGHGWFDIVTTTYGSDRDKILLWMEIPSDCKIVRDYNGKEIGQSVARDFLEKAKTK